MTRQSLYSSILEFFHFLALQQHTKLVDDCWSFYFFSCWYFSSRIRMPVGYTWTQSQFPNITIILGSFWLCWIICNIFCLLLVIPGDWKVPCVSPSLSDPKIDSWIVTNCYIHWPKFSISNWWFVYTSMSVTKQEDFSESPLYCSILSQ